MRLRLDVEAQAPMVVLPVSAHSDAALVCDLGTLRAVNKFCWHDDDGRQVEKIAEVGDDDEEEEACQYCSKHRSVSATLLFLILFGCCCEQFAVPCLLGRLERSCLIHRQRRPHC